MVLNVRNDNSLTLEQTVEKLQLIYMAVIKEIIRQTNTNCYTRG